MWVLVIGSLEDSMENYHNSHFLFLFFSWANVSHHVYSKLPPCPHHQCLSSETTWLHFFLIKKLSSEVINNLTNLSVFCSWAEQLLFRCHSTSSLWFYFQEHCTLALLSSLMPATVMVNRCSPFSLTYEWWSCSKVCMGALCLLLGALFFSSQQFPQSHLTRLHLTLPVWSSARHFLLTIAWCHTDFLPISEI